MNTRSGEDADESSRKRMGLFKSPRQTKEEEVKTKDVNAPTPSIFRYILKHGTPRKHNKSAINSNLAQTDSNEPTLGLLQNQQQIANTYNKQNEQYQRETQDKSSQT